MIALTVWTGDTERAAARAAGFDAFLIKPLDFKQFSRLLNALPAFTPDAPGLELSKVLFRAPITLQTVLSRGETTDEGAIIEAVTLPWFEIITFIQSDPRGLHQVPPRLWEEIIAGAYKRAGFDEVILTPRSGDLGRDVIATKRGIGRIRVIDQVKAFKSGHLVTANDVRALMGVLANDGASKGFLTTTSDFAPRIREDPLIVPWIPSRLELVNGSQLLLRLQDLAKEPLRDSYRRGE